MDKKNYRVIDKVIELDQFGGIAEMKDVILGYSHATSKEQAIRNVKLKKGIKKRGFYYEELNYACDCATEHHLRAEEVQKEEIPV